MMRNHYYRGHRLGVEAIVKVDGEFLPPRLDLAYHSPSGFEWGYIGSGPAQLALALLSHAVGEELALRHYQDFKRAVVRRLDFAGWDLTTRSIREALAAIRSIDRGRNLAAAK